MNNLINLAKNIATPEATLTVAYTPIRLPCRAASHWNYV